MADDEEEESAGDGSTSTVELEPWALERNNYGYNNPFHTFKVTIYNISF